MNKQLHLVCLVGLILLSAVVYLVGNGRVGLWDRDEPRYAQTSRQMLQSGDWVVPHYLDKARTAKPALIYWCQATAMKIFGDDEFAARFPSALATVILLIVLSMVLWKPLGSQMTAWTVFIFATSGLTIAAAKMCITDAVLLLWVTVAQICLYAMWRGNRSWKIIILLSVMIGLAGLTKGPVILGMQATTLLSLFFIKWLDRRYALWRGVAPIPPLETKGPKQSSLSVLIKTIVAIAIVTAIVLPWILMVNHRAPKFLQTGLQHDVWDRMMTPLEQHVGPPGYYFLTIWLTFFPWSLLLPLAIGVAIHRRADPRVRFALAAILGPWIMLEFVRTKLPHYALPVFPPLAYLTADALTRCIRGEIRNLQSRGFIIPTAIWAALVALVASGPWLQIHAPMPMPIAAMKALSIFGVVFGLSVFVAFAMRRAAPAAIAMGLGTFGFIFILYQWYLPQASFLKLSERVADVLIQNHVTQPDQVLMLEYMEPSLAFAQGGTIREAGPVGFSRKFQPLMTPWLVINKTIWDRAPGDLRKDFTVIGQEYGLDYADHGKWTTVMVIKKK
jgi:4-amino-4-deoxy-L-arabinose transferase-like glycosyltransferase